jgi:hypothetical protein
MNEEPVSETDIRRLVGHGSFMDKLKTYVEQLPDDFDMLFIGDEGSMNIS